jgi:glucan 1,3-beta-glucosidase
MDIQPNSKHAAASRGPWTALACVHLLGIVMLVCWVFAAARPVPLPDLQLAAGETPRCVSYAPFHRRGQTPFDEKTVIDRAQIEADLRALAAIAGCVRLYSIDMGLDQVPDIARRLGLEVLLGAWIGGDEKQNALILEGAIGLANAHPDVVRALIVGNEVLLRRERSVEEMRALLAHARARAAVPVTYADVWESWLRHDELADGVDFITVHILPFWEDEPVDIARALEHVAATHARVSAHFPGKDILIGETGWPSAGRQRGEALPSRVNQARFIREFIHQAHARGWDYNLIEAIDQPWKRALEGTVGGHWGLLEAGTLTPKFPLAGAVAERDDIAPPLWGGAVGAMSTLALAALVARRSRVPAASLPRLAALTLVGASSGLIAVLHGEHAWLAYDSASDWFALGAVALAAALLTPALACWPGDALPAADVGWQRMKNRAWARNTLAADTAPPTSAAAELLAALRGFILFAAATASVLLLVAARYRDFPTLLYLAPAAIHGVIGWQGSRFSRAERICALVIACCVVARWLPEMANPQALAWLLCGLALALPALGQSRNIRPRLVQPQQGEQTE